MNCSDFLAGLGIIGLSFSSALNSAFVRAENIDELFKNKTFVNLAFSLMNLLAVAPELEYNIKYNACLRHLWHKLKLEHEEDGLHERRHGATKNRLTALTILAAAIPTAIAHGILFYDANKKMFKDRYGIKLPDEKITNEAVIFAYVFSVLGASQHWLHGAIELAEGAYQQPPIRLFCNSGMVKGKKPYDWLKWIGKNITYDNGVNLLLLLAVCAEFALFRHEFDTQISYNPTRLPEINMDYLSLIGTSLSFMSASMYLGHEGKAFMKIRQTIWQEIQRIRQGNYHDLTLEELLKKQLRALSCLSHVIVHGLVRYQALIHFRVDDSIALPTAGVSALSRLSMLYSQDSKGEHQAVEHAPVDQRESIKYDAYYRGQDVMYEIFFIAMVGATYLYYSEKKLVSIDHKMIMLLSSFPALLCEAAIHLAACARGEKHITNKIDFIINTITAPCLSMLLVTGDHPIKIYNFMDTSVGMVICSLFFRHAQKKLLSYPEVTTVKDKIVAISAPPLRQCGQWAQEKISDLRQHLLFSRPVDNDDANERENEEMSLLPEARRRQESRCAKVACYLSGYVTSAASWCQFFSRSQRAVSNQDSPVIRNRVSLSIQGNTP